MPFLLRGLTPVTAFPLAWALGVAIAQIHILDVQSDWSARAWLVMAVVPVVFVCGAVLGRHLARPGKRSLEQQAGDRGTLRRILGGCVLLGAAEFAHQFIAAGAVPILAANVDAARFAQPGGPTVVLTNLPAVAAAVALSVPRDLRDREARGELLLAAAGLLTVLLGGGRGLVVMPLVVAAIARTVRFGLPRPRFLVAAVLVLVAILSGTFFLRTSQHSTNAFEVELYQQVLPSVPLVLRPLVPVHIGIATNFEALSRIVDHFPGAAPWGDGRYDALAIDAVVPGARNLRAVSAQLSGPWVTSTIAGPLWADAGLWLVVVGVALPAMLVGAAGRVATNTRAHRHVLPAAYLNYVALFGIYTNLWTQHIDWVFVTPLLYLLGAVADGRRPWKVMLAWASGSRMAGGYPGADALRRHRMRARLAVGAAATVLVCLLIGGVIFESGPDARPKPAHPASLPVDVASPLSGGAGHEPLMTDGDLHLDTEPVWSVQRVGGSLRFASHALRGPAPPQTRVVPGAASTLGPATTTDVAIWRDGVRAAFLLRPRPTGVRVVVQALVGPQHRERFFVHDRVLSPGATRDVAVATFSGDLPDLFLLDRGVADERPILSVYSGESDFATRILRVKLPVDTLAPDEWAVDIGRAIGPRPDVVLMKRRGALGRPELHILDGAHDYQRFAMHARLQLSPAVAAHASILAGSQRGVPTVYVVPGGPGSSARIRLIPLTSAPT